MQRCLSVVCGLGVICWTIPLCAQTDFEICASPALAIVDFDTAADSVDVAADIILDDTQLFLDLEHTYVGDLVISLESPGGTSMTVHSNDGGDSVSMLVTFWDFGVGNGTELYTCDCLMMPSGPGTFADFLGESSLGDWTITITDTVLSGGGVFGGTSPPGTLNEWCLGVSGVEIVDPPESLFLRGDASGNGVFNALLDSLFILNYQFNDGPIPPCFRAADADGNNTFNALLDALFILNFQFNGGTAPPEPGAATCGADPDGDSEPYTCDTPDPVCN